MGGLILECGELLYGRFALKVKGAVYRSYIRAAILYGSVKCEVHEIK